MKVPSRDEVYEFTKMTLSNYSDSERAEMLRAMIASTRYDMSIADKHGIKEAGEFIRVRLAVYEQLQSELTNDSY